MAPVPGRSTSNACPPSWPGRRSWTRAAGDGTGDRAATPRPTKGRGAVARGRARRRARGRALSDDITRSRPWVKNRLCEHTRYSVVTMHALRGTVGALPERGLRLRVDHLLRNLPQTQRAVVGTGAGGKRGRVKEGQRGATLRGEQARRGATTALHASLPLATWHGRDAPAGELGPVGRETEAVQLAVVPAEAVYGLARGVGVQIRAVVCPSLRRWTAREMSPEGRGDPAVRTTANTLPLE